MPTTYADSLVQTETAIWKWHKIVYDNFCQRGNGLDVGIGVGKAFFSLYKMLPTDASAYGIDAYRNLSDSSAQSRIDFISAKCNEIDSAKTNIIDLRRRDAFVDGHLDYIPHGSISFMHVDATTLHASYVRLLDKLLSLLKPTGVVVTPYVDTSYNTGVNITRFTALLEHQSRASLYPFAFSEYAIYSTNTLNKAMQYRDTLLQLSQSNQAVAYTVPLGNMNCVQIATTQRRQPDLDPQDSNYHYNLLANNEFVDQFITPIITINSN